MTLLAGTISRGKYTLEIRFELPIRLLPHLGQGGGKKLPRQHARKKQRADRARPGGQLADLANINVKTSMVRNGRIKAHATPTAVCL